MNITQLSDNWDLVIIGGGITGAGIFREAVRIGLKTLLVEKNDFAWGTSSRSSKLIHGGLRYLKEGRLLLTYDSVRQRQRLLNEAPGMVEPIHFMVPLYKGASPGRWTMKAGLSIYDMMAGHKTHAYYDADQFTRMIPHIHQKDLTGGFRFLDAQVDDARLVQRLINESAASGGTALNYTNACKIIRENTGTVSGIQLEDSESKETRTIITRAVINATGTWAEELHPSPRKNLHIRPLRGSHLIFPGWLLPINQAITLTHPADHRPLFIVPWEGALLLGTTDLDHGKDISGEAKISKEEALYMMEALTAYFPSAGIRLKDAVSSLAGVRPVLSKGNKSPSQESREYIVWIDKGLVTVTGGKLTTFRTLAKNALMAAAPYLPRKPDVKIHEPAFAPTPQLPKQLNGLSALTWRRLYGRYGKIAEEMMTGVAINDLVTITGTHTLWAELPLLARDEQVRHLSDLLLRRVRVGLLTKNGGRQYLDRIRMLCEKSLAWDSARWESEKKAYIEHWETYHSIPV
jgi:glycerol-3-phosphate dehydrogenase